MYPERFHKSHGFQSYYIHVRLLISHGRILYPSKYLIFAPLSELLVNKIYFAFSLLFQLFQYFFVVTVAFSEFQFIFDP